MSNSKGSVKRICEQCGAEFKTKPCMIRKGFGKYCCKACADEALKVSPVDRFWSYVDKSGGDSACWPWTGGRIGGGYGRLHLNGRGVTSNRFSYELHYGPIPYGLVVRHKCDNPPCCNPKHLELGTYSDNSADMVARNRQAKGERHGSRTHPGAVKKAIPRGDKHHNARLTAEAVTQIRSAYALGGITMQKLADQYGVRIMAISDAIRGRTWSHLNRQRTEEAAGTPLSYSPG